MLKSDDNSVVKIALDFEVSGRKRQARLQKTCRRKQRRLKEDALNHARWRDGVQAIAEEMGQIWPSLQRGQYWIKNY